MPWHDLIKMALYTGGKLMTMATQGALHMYSRPVVRPDSQKYSRQGVAASIRFTAGSSDAAKPTSTEMPTTSAA